MIHLEFPNISHKSAYIEMIEEWKSAEKTPTSPSTLFKGSDYEEFLQIVTDDVDDPPVENVPATLYFLMEGTRILGAIQIRHHINHPRLMEAGGHIGYGIRPSERRKGYAREMLRLALIEARKLGLEKVLICCHDDNLASYKTIEANDGIFDRYAEFEGEKARRYWVTLY